MGDEKKPKSLTVRLTPQLYSAAQQVAKNRRLSLNAFMQESLAAAVRAAEEKARYDAYTQMAMDRESCDVTYAEHAQGEVMLRDEP